MATGTVHLAPNATTQPDGSTTNLAAGQVRLQGTQTGAKWHQIALTFIGDGTVQGSWWSFRMPVDFASGGTLKLAWIINATTNAVKWQAQVGAITPADADTPLEHALAAAATVTTNVNTTEANRLTESSITLTMDSAAAGDLIELFVFRDSGDAADTSTATANLLAASFEYTTT